MRLLDEYFTDIPGVLAPPTVRRTGMAAIS
jgi:hypothetical protein